MKVVFRVDASLQIGTGHVMRCLTLADALKASGAGCRFICREHQGHMLELIRERGYEAIGLSGEFEDCEPCLDVTRETEPTHAAWLGTYWSTDAEQTLAALGSEAVEWLIVDHYALDARWEHVLRQACRKLMVIDDLADRQHDCDLLLDQNLGREPADYGGWVLEHCAVLTGPRNALLRPEFAALREYSLQRRAEPQLKHLIVTMGGVDQSDVTSTVLEALLRCSLPENCHITVVMGTHAPWLGRVRELAERMPWPTEVKVNISNMAELMADSDLAIGAAGSTAWERCCLGLPTLVLVLAMNQRQVAEALKNKGAVRIIGEGDKAACSLSAAFDELHDLNRLREMSDAGSHITDGQGVDRVLGYLQ